MSKDKLGKKRVCPTTGKKFYDLNKDPVVSPYTGEILSEMNIEDLEKEKIEVSTLEAEVNENEVEGTDEDIKEIDDVIESDNEDIIPEIDEEAIPDLENSTDDEVIDSETEDDINEFDADDLDNLEDEDDDDFINEDDDVSDVIKTVPSENNND
ncbi:MAG: TIGR02300 family protein [Rhodobiaceae bacterium]|nr:TIGR02300 family protein [Rhodobiaceae bacterium]|tara:strand:- start:2627 stop:3088 length:462 start_codon:yes stop_codon:yes gene_type:complete